MRTYTTMTLALAALLAASANLYASGTPSRVDELQAAKQQLARQAAQTKGGPQQLLLMRKLGVSDVIDRLERGERVDPSTIDHLLEESR